jgi:hypothetical protein
MFYVATLKTVEAIPGVKQTLRRNLARTDLNAKEIALLELLRDPDVYVEAGWPAFVALVRKARESGVVREANLRVAVQGEGSAAVRGHFKRLALEAFEPGKSRTPAPTRRSVAA